MNPFCPTLGWQTRYAADRRDQPSEALVLDRPDKPLRVGVAVRSPHREVRAIDADELAIGVLDA